MELNTKGLDSDQQSQIKKSKRLKHQQKLARLVATTFGPDSIDLFKSTMSAAAAVESAVAAHATNTLVMSGQNIDKEVGSNATKSNSLVSRNKTTKKLNKKFNLLQKKITSLIESNQLDPTHFCSSDASTELNNESNKNTGANDVLIAKNQLEKNYRNFQVEEDEVSEVN